jgi:hypothetical protein
MWELMSEDAGCLGTLGAANYAAREFLKHPTTCEDADRVLAQLASASELRLSWWRGVADWAGKKALLANASSIRQWKSLRGC